MSEREALGVAAMQVLRHELSAAVTTGHLLPIVAVFGSVAMQISVVDAIHQLSFRLRTFDVNPIQK